MGKQVSKWSKLAFVGSVRQSNASSNCLNLSSTFSSYTNFIQSSCSIYDTVYLLEVTIE